jgi:glycosyltransferase involved in cell wall biosynthesis
MYASIASGFSGAEQSLCNTISAVLTLGRWQPFALIGRQGLLARRISDMGVPVITARTRVEEAGVESLAEVVAILRARSPDLVHFNSVESWPVLYPVLTRSIPIVQHLRIAEFAGLTRQLQAASALVCVSQFVADCVLQCAVEPDRVHVVYNSVNMSHFFRSPEWRVRARRDLGLTEDTLSVGVVARYAPNKRHDLVVAAASLIPPSRRVHFFFVGETFEHARCLRDIRQAIRLRQLESRITCIGFQTDIRRVLFGFDVLVSASERDPLPRCVIEAMASGIPVVASRSGGHLELVQHGETGLLFEVGDPSSLASAIQELASDPGAGHSLAERASEFVADVLTPEAHVKSIDTIYGSLLRG